MRIIFYNIKETTKPYSMKEFDIVTINDDIDISFKDDRIYIYGQGHHYSEFLYKSTLIDTSLIDIHNLSKSDSFILTALAQKFDPVLNKKVKEEKPLIDINEELGILGN